MSNNSNEKSAGVGKDIAIVIAVLATILFSSGAAVSLESTYYTIGSAMLFTGAISLVACFEYIRKH